MNKKINKEQLQAFFNGYNKLTVKEFKRYFENVEKILYQKDIIDINNGNFEDFFENCDMFKEQIQELYDDFLMYEKSSYDEFTNDDLQYVQHNYGHNGYEVLFYIIKTELIIW